MLQLESSAWSTATAFSDGDSGALAEGLSKKSAKVVERTSAVVASFPAAASSAVALVELFAEMDMREGMCAIQLKYLRHALP